MLKTLVEAFVLVVIVVFLFLGNLRATIIPTVAIPVSLIGTFAVLLALGYSANTVSLLAMVLAIGIVVDDAIVVVENVERVMEEEPDLSPAEATKKAMAQITAPIIAITLVLLSVFVPIGFIPGISGDLFRQFAVTISVAMLISAINALTLSPALVRAVPAPHRAAARHHGLRAAAASTGCATAMPRIVAPDGAHGDVVAGRWSRCSASAFSACRRITPTGFPAGRGPGRVLHRRAVARRRVGRPHQRGRAAGRGRRCSRCRRSQDVLSIVGFSLLDGGNQPNAAFIVVRLKPFADRKAAADSAQATDRRTCSARCSRSARPTCLPFNLPPIIGLSTTGGFEYQLENAGGARSGGDGSVMQGLVAAANQDPRLTRVFSTFTATNPSIYLDIDREKAQALGLNMSDVFTALQATLGGSTSTTSTCSAAPGR